MIARKLRPYLAAALLLSPTAAFAGGGDIGGSTLVEQIAQEATAANQLSTEANTLQNEIQQVQYAAQNLQQLPQNMSQNVFNDLSNLTQLVANANALSYASQNVDGQFQSMYPQYSPNNNYQQLYQQWNEQTSNSIETALQNQGLQSNDFATEQSSLQQLNGLSQSSTGALQALQAGNQISVMEVDQLQKLRQMQMADFDAQMSYMQEQESRQQASDQAIQQETNNWFGTQGSTYSNAGDAQYGQIPAP